jgi:uncharacterized protein YuzE
MATPLDNFLSLLPDLMQAPRHAATVTYDELGDVLYVQFEPGVEADFSDEIQDDVIGRYREGCLLGFTVLNARVHLESLQAASVTANVSKDKAETVASKVGAHK